MIPLTKAQVEAAIPAAPSARWEDEHEPSLGELRKVYGASLLHLTAEMAKSLAGKRVLGLAGQNFAYQPFAQSKAARAKHVQALQALGTTPSGYEEDVRVGVFNADQWRTRRDVTEKRGAGKWERRGCHTRFCARRSRRGAQKSEPKPQGEPKPQSDKKGKQDEPKPKKGKQGESKPQDGQDDDHDQEQVQAQEQEQEQDQDQDPDPDQGAQSCHGALGLGKGRGRQGHETRVDSERNILKASASRRSTRVFLVPLRHDQQAAQQDQQAAFVQKTIRDLPSEASASETRTRSGRKRSSLYWALPKCKPSTPLNPREKSPRSKFRRA